MEFTQEQLAYYEAYERVRASGHWNMFDRAAQAATGLTRDEYMFVMENFRELALAYSKVPQ